jgi:hypothetical protein
MRAVPDEPLERLWESLGRTSSDVPVTPAQLVDVDRRSSTLTSYPDLNLAQVHSALAYYYDHQDEIDAELARDEGADERYERRRAEDLLGRRSCRGRVPGADQGPDPP